jgi:adenylate cyclase
MLRRSLPLLLPFLVLLLGVGLRAWDPSLLRDFRFRAFDIFQQLHPRPYDPTLPVRIVAIDEASLQEYGQWPWSRSLLAELVDKLDAAGAASIAFDVIFPEPDRSSVTVLMQGMVEGPARQALELALASGALVDHDEAFAASIAKAPVVLALAMTSEEGLPPAPPPKVGIPFGGESPLAYVRWHFPNAITNLPILNDAASGLGSIDILKDRDGKVRRIPLILAAADTLYPSLAVEALRVAQNSKQLNVKVSGAVQAEQSGEATGIQAVRAGKVVLRTIPTGEIWLYDTGHQDTRFLSAAAVLDGTADPALLQGAIVFVGATATGLFDAHSTPLSALVPGVEQHAQTVEQALTQEFLARPIWADQIELIGVAVVGLLVLAAFSSGWLGPIWSAVLGFAAVVLAVGTAWYAFVYEHLLLDPLTPSAVGLAVYGTAAITSYLNSERRRREVREAFGHYVSPAVVARIADNPKQVNLGGESRELTILFCDIRGFTSLSEKLNPEALTRLINRFLTEMSTAVLESGGTIDKYIGDCLMGFWNAPLDVPDHAGQAAGTVLEMRRRLSLLNRDLRREAETEARAPQLSVGIGLNTGTCSVGNMGSTQRLAYTCVGDAVNLAARLEGLTKLYGLDCLFSETTAAGAVQEGFVLVEIDRIRVKGKEQATSVFALVGRPAEAKPFLPAIELIGQFLKEFRAGDWTKAAAALEGLAPLVAGGPYAGVARRYSDRLSAYAGGPPPDDWDGVFVATEK